MLTFIMVMMRLREIVLYEITYVIMYKIVKFVIYALLYFQLGVIYISYLHVIDRPVLAPIHATMKKYLDKPCLNWMEGAFTFYTGPKLSKRMIYPNKCEGYYDL